MKSGSGQENVVLTDLPAIDVKPKIVITAKVIPRPCPYCDKPIAEHEQVNTDHWAQDARTGERFLIVHFVHRDPEGREGLAPIIHVRHRPPQSMAEKCDADLFKFLDQQVPSVIDEVVQKLIRGMQVPAELLKGGKP